MARLVSRSQDSTAITLPAGTVLIRRGQTASDVLHLQQGRVRLGLMDDSGMAHQLGKQQGPVWLEAASVLLDQPYVIDVVAETDVRIEKITLADFRSCCKAWPAASRELMRDLALSQRQQVELAISRLAKDADARCAEWLLQHAEPAGQGLAVVLRERKRLIAAQLGMAPETFSRVLRQLRDRNLISGAGRV
jgi:CRP-like cAMP-binding protein